MPKGDLSQVEDENVTFNVLKALKDPPAPKSCHQIDIMNKRIFEDPIKITKHPKEQDKVGAIHLKPTNTKAMKLMELNHHFGATSHYH